jgi:hypothetical protein
LADSPANGSFFEVGEFKVKVNHFKQVHTKPLSELLIVGEHRREKKYILKDLVNGKAELVPTGNRSVEIISSREYPRNR